MHRRVAALVGLTAICSGCVSAEGLGTSIKTPCLYWERPIEMQRMPDESTDASAIPATNAIAIGRVTAYRKYDGDNVAKGYERYSACSDDGPPMLSASEFARTMAGWTAIELVNWGFARLSSGLAMVPTELAESVSYVNKFESGFLGRAGDLVAARTNDDGVMVITKVLCENTPDFHACVALFENGLFDPLTGRQLTYKGLPKNNGVRIDTESYRPVPIQ